VGHWKYFQLIVEELVAAAADAVEPLDKMGKVLLGWMSCPVPEFLGISSDGPLLTSLQHLGFLIFVQI
jgi:hypothetical protein